MIRPLTVRMRRVASMVAARWVLRRSSPVGYVVSHRVPIQGDDAEDVDGHETVLRLQAAAQLLGEHSPVHYRWLLRSVGQLVLVPPMRAPAAYERVTRSVLVSRDVAHHYDATALAAVLAHEAAHGRIADWGWRAPVSQSEEHRRVERRCVREQLDALLKIDPGHELVDWSRGLLEPANSANLAPTADQARLMIQQTYRRVRDSGYPRWVARLVVRGARILARS